MSGFWALLLRSKLVAARSLAAPQQPVSGRQRCVPPGTGENVVMEAATARRDIVVLGSTGSIGTQAADIVRRNPGRFRVSGLAAGGGNPGLLASQALEFGADVVAVASEAAVKDLRAALHAQAGAGSRLPKILAGPDAIAEVAAWPCDVILNGVTG